jgi:acylphosphatase
MTEVQRVRVEAAGLVQGVYFRSAVRDEAERLGLTGWVRNRDDGRVEAEFQGAPGAVAEAVSFCRGDPGQARVDDLSVVNLPPVEGEHAFAVQ